MYLGALGRSCRSEIVGLLNLVEDHIDATVYVNFSNIGNMIGSRNSSSLILVVLTAVSYDPNAI